MGFAELRAKADGNVMIAEREIFAAVKKRGSSAITDLIGGQSGAMASMLNESYGTSSRAKEAYAQITNWVWSCIHAVAKRCTMPPWMAGHFEKPANGERRAGPLTSKGYQRSRIPSLRKSMAWSEQDIEQDPDHPVLWTLDKPNHVQGKAELIYMMVANILATGEWYWIGGVVGQNSKKKIEIWAVPSSWIVPDHRAGPFRGYILQTGYGTGIPLPPENVARAYFPDPADPKGCMSPLSACIRAARIDNYILRSQEQSFERGINPNLLVTVGKYIGPDGKVMASPPRLNGAQRRQIIRAVRHIWSQTVSAGDPAILDGLIEDVKKLQMTPQEMDWLNSGNAVKARIMQAFGVNPIILGEVTPANKAQAVVAESNFLRNVVNPLLSGISTAASAFFTPFYEDGDTLAVWLEQAEAHDDELELRRMDIARRNGDVEQDEFRAYMGLPPAEAKEPERSPLFNNPQTLAQVAALAAQVSAGAMTHDNAVQTLMVMLQISKKDADAMMPDDPPEPPPMPAVPPGGSPVDGVPGAPGGQPAAAKPPAKPKPPKPAVNDEETDKAAAGLYILGYDPTQSHDEDENAADMYAEITPAAEFLFLGGHKSINTKIARSLVKAAHQAQHRRMERKMQRAMVPFFQKAVRSIVADLKVPADATREQAERAVERAFDKEKLDKLLADTAGPVLADGFVEGATAERMLVAAAMRRRAFNPDQPRDDRGRWAGGGGGFSTAEEASSWIKSSGLASDVDLGDATPSEASAIARGLEDSLSVGGHRLTLRSVKVTDEGIHESTGAGYSNGHLTISNRHMESIRAHDPAAVAEKYDGTGGKRSYGWEAGKTPEDALRLTVAHEVGHHVDTAMLVDTARAWREVEADGIKITDDEIQQVSGYATTHPTELFAEVHAFVSTPGYESEVPAKLKTWYVRVIKNADEPFPAFTRGKSFTKASTATDALGDFDEDDLDDLDIPTEYPDWLREAAQDFVLRSFRQDYWQRINQTTRDDILGTLWSAIEDGLSIREIATRIMEQHGAAYSRARATMVARTEMTGAMNAGHTEAIREAYSDIPGIEPAKELLSVLGTTTRPTHAEADGQQRPLDEDFDIGGYPAAYPGDARLPPEERINCQCHHPDNVLIGNVLGALRTRYSGNMAEVVTALGRRFAVTINHPVPTANRGMVAAGKLKKGDDLLLYDGPIHDPASGMAAGDNEQHEPATAREVCELVFASAPLDAIEVRVSLEDDLHGDGRLSGPEIEVVLPHRHLRDERELVSQGEHGELCLAAVDVSLVPLAGASTLAERVGTPSGSDSVLHASKVPFMRTSGPCACYTFGPCADWYSSLGQNATKSAFATVKFLRQCYESLTGRVSGDNVRDVRIFHYDGPVYEFQTRNGTIFANGVMVSNCTIISAFVGEGLSDEELSGERAYDPSQPRDDHGRFASTGSSGSDDEDAGFPKDGTVSRAGLDARFKPAGDTVDGRVVRDPDDVPNRGSIESSLDDYEVLPGIREVKLSDFENSGQPSFYSASEKDRTERLAAAIKESGEISPLIVVVDKERSPYILEGGHRFDALRILEAKSFPALVVIDTGSVEITDEE